MRLSARTSTIGLLSASLLALFACAASTEHASPVVDPDGGTNDETIVPVDAGAASPDSDADIADAAAEDAATDGDAAPSVEVCNQQSWCHLALPPDQTLRDVWGDGAGTVWSVAEEGNILRWDGTKWVIHHSVTGKLHAIWGSGPTDIWVGGDDGLLHGQGASSSSIVWTPVSIPAALPILSIWGAAADDIWAVGGKAQTATQPHTYEGEVFHYAGPADGWVLDPISSQPAAFSRVWGASSSDVWIGGDMSASKALVLRGAPDGSGAMTWTEETLTLRKMTGGAAITRDSVLILGPDLHTVGAFFTGVTTDEGDTFSWVASDYGVGWSYFDAWGSSKNDVWLAGSYGRLHHWDGTSWSIARISVTKFPVVNTFHAIWGGSPDDIWVVGENIALRKRPLGQQN